MHLASKDSTKVLTANGTSDGAALSLQRWAVIYLHHGGSIVSVRMGTVLFSN